MELVLIHLEMVRITMICSVCLAELGFAEVESAEKNMGVYICGNCNYGRVPDPNNVIEDIPEYVEEDTTNDIKETPTDDEAIKP